MPSRAAAKARGTKAERAVVDWLQSKGWIGAERAPRWGARDRGDIVGVPNLCIQIADTTKFEPSKLDEAVAQARNCDAWLEGRGYDLNVVGRYLGILLRRRKGKPSVGEWMVCLRADDFLELWCEAKQIEKPR